MNHYDNFVKTMHTEYSILSGPAQYRLIALVNEAMKDAYERGVAAGQGQPNGLTEAVQKPLKLLADLTRKDRRHFNEIKMTQGLIPAIKAVRAMTHAGLKEAKEYVEALPGKSYQPPRESGFYR